MEFHYVHLASLMGVNLEPTFFVDFLSDQSPKTRHRQRVFYKFHFQPRTFIDVVSLKRVIASLPTFTKNRTHKA